MMKWKQRLSAALIVAMAVSLFPAQAFAAENEQRWSLTEEGWQYRKDGELKSNYMVTENRNGVEHNYYIKDDTYMATNELFSFEFEKDGKIRTGIGFALPDGEVLKRKWVILQGNLEGAETGNPSGLSIAPNASVANTDWYYFDDYMRMAINRMEDDPKEINGDYFRFDGDGKMLRDVFESYEVNGKPVKQYHQHDGWLAKNKWLYNFQDKDNQEGWYFFEDNGNCRMATSSDATRKFDVFEVDETGLLVSDIQPCPTVEGLNVKGGAERKVSVGQSTTITFEAQLASNSNAGYKNSGLTKNHDFWCERNIDDTNMSDGAVSVKVNTPADNTSKECSVVFSSTAPGTVTLVLHVDDKSSDEIVIDVVAEEAKAKSEAIESALKDPESITDPNAAKETLVKVYGKDSEETDAETAKELKKTWVEQADNVAVLDGKYAMANNIKQEHDYDEVSDLLDTSQVSVVGASLNGDKDSTVSLQMKKPEEGAGDNVNLELKDEAGNALRITGRVDLDISFYVNGQEKKDLSLPLIITVPVPEGLSEKDLKLFHTTDDGKTEEVDIVLKDGKVTFAADQFSIYTFVNAVSESGTGEPDDPNKPGNNTGGNTGGSSSGGSSGRDRTSSAMTMDSKKGYIDSVKGIITGSGSGYSSWVSQTGADGQMLWWLRYADGTYPAGSIITRADGSTYEQPAWEKINGSWYAFGADGYAKGGWVYDEALGGYFYIDIQTGMKTGWVQIDGQWHYFSPVSDGRMGIMVTDITIDGYYINAAGVWVEA